MTETLQRDGDMTEGWRHDGGVECMTEGWRHDRGVECMWTEALLRRSGEKRTEEVGSSV